MCPASDAVWKLRVCLWELDATGDLLVTVDGNAPLGLRAVIPDREASKNVPCATLSVNIVNALKTNSIVPSDNSYYGVVV